MDLAGLEPHERASWSADTCDPVDLPWSAANPSRRQCGVTALVLQDLTREQFAAHERVGDPRVVVRPAGPPGRRREQYALLRDRVDARLRGD